MKLISHKQKKFKCDFAVVQRLCITTQTNHPPFIMEGYIIDVDGLGSGVSFCILMFGGLLEE